MQRTSSRLAVRSLARAAGRLRWAGGSGSVSFRPPARSRRAVSNIAGPVAIALVRR